jgi:N-acetylneuraminic acid mutarotase
MGNAIKLLSPRNKVVEAISKENWKELKSKENEPKSRSLHSSCYVESKNSIIIFGGRINHSEGEIIYNDTTIFDCNSNSYREIVPILIDTIPTPRYGHSSIIHQNKEMIIYGGTSKTKVFSEIWKFDLENEEWTEIKPINSKLKPKGRFNHSCCLYENSLVIFGGSSKSCHFNNLFFFDLTSLTWREKKNVNPPKMEGHSACIFNDSMFIFGGHSIVQEFNHLFKFNFLNESWCKISTFGSIPKERAFHSAVVFSNYMYILGDVDLQDDHLYEFDLIFNIWRIRESNSPKIAYHTAVINSKDENMVLFGGETSWNQSQNKTFIYHFPIKNSNNFDYFYGALSHSQFLDVDFIF